MAAAMRGPGEVPGSALPASGNGMEGGSRWLPLHPLHHLRGPAQHLGRLWAPISASFKPWSLLALICKWASAQAKDAAGIRPDSQTLNWSRALHYLHTCFPAPYGLR